MNDTNMKNKTMKKLFFAILTVTTFLVSCQMDDLILDHTTADIVGVYQLERTSTYPTIGKNITITNNLELTFTPDYKDGNQVLIEELGIYAKINDNKVDIPFQTDAPGQFSYTGYGEINGIDIQLFLNIRNHTSNTTQTSKIHGQRLEFLD